MVKQALKLYVNTILAGAMGFFVYLAIGVIFSIPMGEGQTVNPTVTLWMNVVALLLQGILFFIIVYGKMWELGDKNANAVNFGRMPDDPVRGFKIGLLAAIPSILSFVALVVDKLFGLWNGMATAYRICHLALYPVIVWSFGPLVTVTTADISWVGILCAGLPILFMPAVAALSYYLGYRHIVLWEKIVFSDKQK